MGDPFPTHCKSLPANAVCMLTGLGGPGPSTRSAMRTWASVGVEDPLENRVPVRSLILAAVRPMEQQGGH